MRTRRKNLRDGKAFTEQVVLKIFRWF